MALIYISFITPLGYLHVARSSKGICGVALGSRVRFMEELERRFGTLPVQERSSLSDIIERFRSYFDGKRVEFNTLIDLTGLTEFQKKVLLEVKKIPYGKLKTYGEIAASVGNARASRAVGQALSQNPLLILIPCHRVVLNNGGLGGFSDGLSVKKELLRLENAWPL